MTGAEQMTLRGAARDLHEQFRGIFGAETIESLPHSSYAELAATATVRNWLRIGAERFARQRLQALAHARTTAAGRIPSVLSLCVHNAGVASLVQSLAHAEIAGATTGQASRS
jgi:arsenate reductase (thioredoxin)